MLMIAGGSEEISWTQEIGEVTRQFQAQVIIGGQISPQGIAAAVTGKHFDIIHIAAHGYDEGIELGGGHLMSLAELTRLALSTNAQLVFLNACRSVVPMQRLYAAGVPSVVAYGTDVLDADALSIATYFYGGLAGLDDVAAAFERVDPRDGTLVMLPGSRSTPDKSVQQIKQRQLVTLASIWGQMIYWAIFGGS